MQVTPAAVIGLAVSCMTTPSLGASAAAGVASPKGAPAPVVVPDTIEQRVAACTTCHGRQGRAARDGYYPRIAGKPAGYLYNQLVNFREGRRHYAPMTYLVEHLSEPYLHEIAQHFADLEVPYPPPPTGLAPPAMLSHGRTLVTAGDKSRNIPACVQCHAQSLMGIAPSIPGLVGLPRDYINSQLGAWKTGLRRAHAPDCMGQIAQQLTTDDVAALSAWLAMQPVAQGAKPAAGPPRELPLRCGGVSE